MKKLLLTLMFGAAVAAWAQVTNTYTNGYTARLPISDQQYSQLVYVRRSTGQTNVPVAQFVTNNVQATLIDSATAAINLRRWRIQAAIQNADDALLSQVEAVLGL